jgi:hypothetical protein
MRSTPSLRSVFLAVVAQLVAGCSSGGSGAGGAATVQQATATAPAITAQPANQSVTAGQPASFSVAVSGTAPLAYQWSRNGAAITGAMASSYATGPTTASDSGATFTVAVSNSAGTATSDPATLTVNAAAVAPTITTQPGNVAVTTGQTATFAVATTGTAPLSYQWKKDGNAIAGATASSYTTPATSASDNNATFSVTISNAAGTVASNDAVLTVRSQTSALTISTSSLPNGVVQGQYSATVQASGGTTPYAWTVLSGQLPAGLTLSGTSGMISGTPTAAGTASFTISVHDATGAATTLAASITISASVATAPFGHVVIVVEENTDYSSVISNPATMPYLTALISSYGLATQYYADTHPSIGNYLMLVTGQMLTNDDNQTPASFPVATDNVVRQLVAHGKTWKAYAEDLPSVGYTGGDTAGYAVRHAPLAYLTDVQNSAAAKQNLVPFTHFAADLAGAQLPSYSFVTPNLCDDAHNCGLDVADTWLQTNIGPLLADASFKSDGLLVIVFDESGSDNTHGGGQVVAVVISPAFSKTGYRSTTLYQHESTLRLLLEGLGVKSLPGAAAAAPPMWEFFNFPPPP